MENNNSKNVIYLRLNRTKKNIIKKILYRFCSWITRKNKTITDLNSLINLYFEYLYHSGKDRNNSYFIAEKLNSIPNLRSPIHEILDPENILINLEELTVEDIHKSEMLIVEFNKIINKGILKYKESIKLYNR